MLVCHGGQILPTRSSSLLHSNHLLQSNVITCPTKPRKLLWCRWQPYLFVVVALLWCHLLARAKGRAASPWQCNHLGQTQHHSNWPSAIIAGIFEQEKQAGCHLSTTAFKKKKKPDTPPTTVAITMFHAVEVTGLLHCYQGKIQQERAVDLTVLCL